MKLSHVHIKGQFTVVLDHDTGEYRAIVEITSDRMSLREGEGGSPRDALVDAFSNDEE